MVVTFWKIVKNRVLCGQCSSENLKEDKHKNIVCKKCKCYVMLVG